MKKLVFSTLSALALLPVSVLAAAPGVLPDGPSSVPEPTSLILIITGVVGVLGLRRIFKK